VTRTDKKTSIRYFITDCESEQAAYNLALATAPNTLELGGPGVMLIESIEIEPLGNTNFYGLVSYSTAKPEEDPTAGDSPEQTETGGTPNQGEGNAAPGSDPQAVISRNWSFSTGGGTQHITHSITTVATYVPDGADVPTSFNLSNSTLSYSFGTSEANILSLPTQYTATLDVNGAGQLSQISDRIRTYVPRLSPTSITVTTATTYQPIVFDNTQAQSGGQYYYPNNWWANGTDVNIYLSFLATGGVTPNYYTKIVGQSHEITPDLWQTTYQLLKGR